MIQQVSRVAKIAVVSVMLLASVRAQDREIPFTQVTIDPQPPERPWYKMVGDVSGDGLTDIVVGGARGPLIAYIAPDWKKTQLADGGWRGVNGEIADLDGDGDRDIVMGGIVWFQNPGNINGVWKRNQVDDQTAHDIEIADLNGDGRLDIVARDQSAFGGNGNEVSVYHQGKTGWRKQVIACPHGEGLKLGDIDSDGDADIVIGGLWYENRGDLESRWSERSYTTAWTELGKGSVAHEKEHRTFFFYPLVKEEKVKKSAARDLIQNVFGGNVGGLVSYLLENENISSDELSAIRKLIDQKKKSK